MHTCWGGGAAHSEDCNTGPSDHTGDSDSNSFQHHFDITNYRNIRPLRGDSD